MLLALARVRVAPAVLALICALGAADPAAAEGRHRFHVLTPRLVQRLSPGARAGVHAVVRVGLGGRGTGFLVKGVPGQDATGLVLTNEHVGADAAGETLTFFDGATARVGRVLVASKRLDYALLEIDLPPASTARPARPSDAIVLGGERGYAISASANPFSLSAPARDSLSNARHVAPSGSGLWTIQLAAERGNGLLTCVPVAGSCVNSLSFAAPNAPGASGSPIFSARTHEVIALHWGGGGVPGDWRSSAVPTWMILADLSARGYSLR